MEFLATCPETVSLLRALVLGAGEACVQISVPSLIGLLVPFVVVVLGLQWLTRRLLFGAPKRRSEERRGPVVPRTGQLLPTPDGGDDATLRPDRGIT